jgi:hypothetical protein
MGNPIETIKDPSAIEVLVCMEIESSFKRELTKDEFEIFAKLILSKDKGFSIPEKEQPFVYKVIEARAKSFQYKLTDPRLILFLAMIAESPGKAVMYLWYIQYIFHKKGLSNIDLECFGTEILPMGYPTNERLSEIWDGQKVNRPRDYYGSDNLLDYMSAGESIMFKPKETEK